MNISIGNLTITSFCSDNASHIKFRNELKEDDLIFDFVSDDIEDDLQEVSNDKEIEIGNSYIIEDKDDLVGYIYILSILGEKNTVELRYAVHPEYRRLGYLGYSDSTRRGYGQQILEECSKYLFNLDGIDTIELHIRKDNEASIKCAEKAQYKCLGRKTESIYIYRAFKNN